MHKKNTYPILLICTIILLVLAVTLFIRNFETMKKGQRFRTRQSHVPMIVVDQIQGWMTFEYLNRAFNLPSDYLKNELSITSLKYPKITLRQVSLLNGITISDFIAQVKKSIGDYVIPQNITP